MQVKIVNLSKHPLPEYATPQSAGLDLRANIEAPITLNPLERTLVPTGLYIALPEGYEAQVRPRSGLALKHGITVLNSPGTVDADYRGELRVILVNLSNEPFVINDGERTSGMATCGSARRHRARCRRIWTYGEVDVRGSQTPFCSPRQARLGGLGVRR